MGADRLLDSINLIVIKSAFNIPGRQATTSAARRGPGQDAAGSSRRPISHGDDD
jgi:hypothetical protein